MRTVAALYIDPRGPYPKMANVECWDEQRDARLYAGPHPVVAHPPCGRWCQLAAVVEKRYGYKRGEDGGTFESALASVRKWGGVLEHPAWTKAWAKFGLQEPPAFGWQRCIDGSWVCQVSQVAWGHRAQKKTWLLLCGADPPATTDWSSPKGHGVISGMRNNCGRPLSERVWPAEARKTPPAFAEFLVELARNSRKDPMTHPKNTLAQRPELDGDGQPLISVSSRHTEEEIQDLDLIAAKLAEEWKGRGIRKRVSRGDAVRTAIKFYRENAPLVLVKAEGS